MPRKILFRLTDGTPEYLDESLADNEAELNNLIKDHPELIPVEDLDVDPPLLVIGKDLVLGSGEVDLLCLARTGDLFVIEFKTGPQNTDFRCAIAQLLDYGSHLWQMSVTEFEVLATTRLGIPLETAIEQRWGYPASSAEASQIKSRISDQLASGRFTYMVAAQRFTAAMQRRLSTWMRRCPARSYDLSLCDLMADRA
jgi:hypothetical protein